MSVIEHGCITPNSAVTLRARVANEDGSYITIATTEALSAVVTDMSTTTAGSPITFTVASAVHDTLQLTNWTKDSTGYNVSITLDGANFPASERIYQVVLTITPTDGDVMRKVWKLLTAEVI